MMRHLLSFLTAGAILFLATPFIPSSVLIQLRTLEVQDGKAKLTRTVTIPTDAHMTYEIGRGSLALPECNRDAPLIHYERRSTPISFDLICEPPEGDWTMRYCVAASGWLGITLAPSCIETDFTVGPTYIERLEMQQMILEDKIIKLEGKLDEAQQTND